MRKNRETCEQYVERQLSEGWRIAGRWKHTVYLSPPDGSFIHPVDLRNDVETLRPNAAGDETNIPTTGGMGTGHWGRVSDESDETYVGNANYIWTRDLYHLSSPSGSGVINFVRIYIRIRSIIEAGWRKTALKIDGSVYETSELVINNENFYTTFITSPLQTSFPSPAFPFPQLARRSESQRTFGACGHCPTSE